jgi:hypothetical protein
LSARAIGDGLGNDAYIIDAGLPKRVHYSGKAAEWNRFIAPKEDTFLPVFQLRLDPWAELMNVDGFIAEVNALGFIHGDDQALLIDFLYSARLWDVDFDAGLEDRRGNHENNEQYENYVHERDHVDLGERSLRRFGKLRHLL